MSRYGKNARGFLMIEALIALAIFTIAFTALTALISQALLVSDKAQKHLRAVSAMESFLLAAVEGGVSSLSGCDQLMAGEFAGMHCQVEEAHCEESYCYYESRFLGQKNDELLKLDFFMPEEVLS